MKELREMDLLMEGEVSIQLDNGAEQPYHLSRVPDGERGES